MWLNFEIKNCKGQYQVTAILLQFRNTISNYKEKKRIQSYSKSQSQITISKAKNRRKKSEYKFAKKYTWEIFL